MINPNWLTAKGKYLRFDGLILFFIECKRAKPEIKNWIFNAEYDKARSKTTFLLKEIRRIPLGENDTICVAENLIKHKGFLKDLVIMIENILITACKE